jgi:hypothetical protein
LWGTFWPPVPRLTGGPISQVYAVPRVLPAEGGSEGAAVGDIHGVAKEVFEFLFEGEAVEVRTVGIEIDEKVDSAVRGVLGADDSAEDSHVMSAVAGGDAFDFAALG